MMSNGKRVICQVGIMANRKFVNVVVANGEITRELVKQINKLYQCIPAFYLITPDSFKLILPEELNNEINIIKGEIK